MPDNPPLQEILKETADSVRTIEEKRTTPVLDPLPPCVMYGPFISVVDEDLTVVDAPTS